MYIVKLGGKLHYRLLSKTSSGMEPITIEIGYGLLIGYSTSTGQSSAYMVANGNATALSSSDVFAITRVDEYHISVVFGATATFIIIGY